MPVRAQVTVGQVYASTDCRTVADGVSSFHSGPDRLANADGVRIHFAGLSALIWLVGTGTDCRTAVDGAAMGTAVFT